MKSIFISKGYPDQITSNNGPQFASRTYKEYLTSIGVQPRFITPYWPQANGLVERLNQVFLKAFKAAIIDGRQWKNSLHPFLFAYRTTPQTTTGKTPAFLLFNREFKTKLPGCKHKDSNMDDTRELVAETQIRQKQYADRQRHAQYNTLKTGDKVLLKRLIYKNKLESTFDPRPATILKVEGGHLKIRTHDNVIVYRNVHLVRKANLPTDTRMVTQDSRTAQASPVRVMSPEVNSKYYDTQAPISSPRHQRATRSATGTRINRPMRFLT